MTIVVAYKWAANPQDASTGDDGVVDWSRAQAAISEYDPIAVQLARNVADATGADLVGVSVGTSGTGSSIAKKAAMSRDMDRGLVVADDVTATWNLTQVGAALAKLVERVVNADLVVAGEASIDENARMVPAIAAGYLGWPSFQGVTAVERAGEAWVVTQTVPGGSRTIEVAGPVVVSITPDAVQAKVPGMKQILAAGKKTVEQIAVEDLAAVTVPVEVVSRSKPVLQARKNKRFSGDNAANDMVAAMRADAVL